MDYFDKVALGARIRALRGDMTLIAWAEKLGMSKSAIDQWEKGRNFPNAELLIKLWIHHPDIDLVALLTGSSSKRAAPALTADERSILLAYREMSKENRATFMATAIAFHSITMKGRK